MDRNQALLFQFANRSTAAKIPSRDKELVFGFWENKRDLADLPVSARSSKKHKALARSSKKRKARSSANEHKALVKCAVLWAEQRNVVGGFYFRKYFTDLRVKRGPSSDSSFGRED